MAAIHHATPATGVVVVNLNIVGHSIADGVRRRWTVPVVMVAAMLLSACHFNPYRWPRPGEPAAATLENQLNKRDSLQSAAKDFIGVAAAMRDAVQQAYPAAQWAPTSDGTKSNCAPPFIFLTGSTYILPVWRSVAPSSTSDVKVVVTAAANALKAHHAEQITPNPERSVGGVLLRERGRLEFTVMEAIPSNPPHPPEMTITGVTECHHIAPGPGPWDTPVQIPPAPKETPAPPPENMPTLPPGFPAPPSENMPAPPPSAP
jgi:hypothetical protein